MGGVVLFFLSKPPIHQKYSSLPHTQTFMSPSSFPLTHKHSQPKMIPLHPPTQHRAHLHDVPHLSITSAHLPTLPARTPMQRGIEGAPGEGGGRTTQAYGNTKWYGNIAPKLSHSKGSYRLTVFFYFLPRVRAGSIIISITCCDRAGSIDQLQHWGCHLARYSSAL